jgi:hypothetical protein
MLPDLDISKVILVGLSDMAETFVDKLPALPTINVANIQKYNMSDVVLEWVGAVRSTAKLPTLAIGEVKLSGRFVHSCLVVLLQPYRVFGNTTLLNGHQHFASYAG